MRKISELKEIWCMCLELEHVARDGFSTCSICGGRDAYGGAKSRPTNKHKVVNK